MTRTDEGEQAPDDVLVALADPIRREVLAVLAREGGRRGGWTPSPPSGNTASTRSTIWRRGPLGPDPPQRYVHSIEQPGTVPFGHG
jgi:hypothetical protein